MEDVLEKGEIGRIMRLYEKRKSFEVSFRWYAFIKWINDFMKIILREIREIYKY